MSYNYPRSVDFYDKDGNLLLDWVTAQFLATPKLQVDGTIMFNGSSIEYNTWTAQFSNTTNCTAVTLGDGTFIKVGFLCLFKVNGTCNVTSDAGVATGFDITLPKTSKKTFDTIRDKFVSCVAITDACTKTVDVGGVNTTDNKINIICH